MTMPSNPTPGTNRRWQFSIRALLGTVTAVAAITAFLRDSRADADVDVAWRLLAISLVISACCVPTAWRKYRARYRRGTGTTVEFAREKLAVVCGLLGLLPYGCFWSMLALDSFESWHPVVHGMMVVAYIIALMSFVPVTLATLISLVAFWGLPQNLPLLILRLCGLAANGLEMPYAFLAIAASV